MGVVSFVVQPTSLGVDTYLQEKTTQQDGTYKTAGVSVGLVIFIIQALSLGNTLIGL